MLTIFVFFLLVVGHSSRLWGLSSQQAVWGGVTTESPSVASLHGMSSSHFIFLTIDSRVFNSQKPIILYSFVSVHIYPCEAVPKRVILIILHMWITTSRGREQDQCVIWRRKGCRSPFCWE